MRSPRDQRTSTRQHINVAVVSGSRLMVDIRRPIQRDVVGSRHRDRYRRHSFSSPAYVIRFFRQQRGVMSVVPPRGRPSSAGRAVNPPNAACPVRPSPPPARPRASREWEDPIERKAFDSGSLPALPANLPPPRRIRAGASARPAISACVALNNLHQPSSLAPAASASSPVSRRWKIRAAVDAGAQFRCGTLR